MPFLRAFMTKKRFVKNKYNLYNNLFQAKQLDPSIGDHRDTAIYSSRFRLAPGPRKRHRAGADLFRVPLLPDCHVPRRV